MATYYVDNVLGDDGNSGTGTTEAWATFSRLMSGLTTGNHDVVYVKGGSTYTEPLVITVDGGYNEFISFEGYTGTPGDGGKITIAPTSGVNCGSFSGTANNWSIRNVIFDATNVSDDAFYMPGSRTAMYYNCEFNNSAADGLQTILAFIYKCSADNNSAHGFNTPMSLALYCTATNNGGRGISVTQGGHALYSIAYNNTSENIYATPSGFQPALALGCVTDGGGTSTYGIRVSNAGCFVSAINNIAVNSAIGIDVGANYPNALLENNIAYNNTANFGTYTGTTNIVSDPLFVDETGNDYRLGTGSPGINAGIGINENSNGTDIGAYQSQDAGTKVIVTG